MPLARPGTAETLPPKRRLADARPAVTPSRSASALAAMSAGAAKAKVLVVDDDPAHRALLRHLAPHDQVELIEAASGAQALSLTALHDFALILTDVRMPGMDGFELAAALEASEKSREVPVIFLTAGEASELSQLRGYAFGAVDYMLKPVNETVLKTKLKVFVELWGSRQQLKGLLDALEERNKKLEEEIAERRRIETLVRHQAQHDALTSLPNRILFLDRLDTALERAERHQECFALLYVDIDGFKPVNDNHGHSVGDEVLRHIGLRLAKAVRKTDTVARLGGDEFALILEEVASERAALQVGLKLCEVLATPYSLDLPEGLVTVRLGASIGVAVFPDHGRARNDLINAADAAMYRAKRNGKNHAVLAELPRSNTVPLRERAAGP